MLDVGCGSGVLAIAAARLGFAQPVGALDLDPQAVEATERNARANGVLVDASLSDATTAPLPAADLAVANIAPEPVRALGPRLRSPRVITSGYLLPDRPELPGYAAVRRVEREGWAADLHVRQ